MVRDVRGALGLLLGAVIVEADLDALDQQPGAVYGTGAIVNVAKVTPMPKAGGKWNTLEITAKGSKLTVVLNGVQTVDIEHAKFVQGPLALQYGIPYIQLVEGVDLDLARHGLHVEVHAAQHLDVAEPPNPVMRSTT